jgi:hypothetical protein
MTKLHSSNKGRPKKSAPEDDPPCKKIASRRSSPKNRRLDILKGQFTVPSDFSDPLPEEELKSWGS